jgi:hypothetical protein
MNVYEVVQRLLSFFDLYSKPVYVSIIVRDDNNNVISYKDIPVISVGCFSNKTTINIEKEVSSIDEQMKRVLSLLQDIKSNKKD